jgi:hypothetical protein
VHFTGQTNGKRYFIPRYTFRYYYYSIYMMGASSIYIPSVWLCEESRTGLGCNSDDDGAPLPNRTAHFAASDSSSEDPDAADSLPSSARGRTAARGM